MKRNYRKCLAAIIALSMAFSTVYSTPYAVAAAEVASLQSAADAITVNAAGWKETAYAEWLPVEGAASYEAFVKGNTGDYVKLDNELIRQYPDYWRADAVGLAAGTYTMKIVAKDADGNQIASAEKDGLAVTAYDRSGSAFSSKSPLGTASGAYNDDGTLKSTAQVVYITPETAKTVKADVITNNKGKIETFTGFQNIVTALQKGYDKRGFDFRIVGLIDASDMDKFDSSEEGLQMKGKNANSEMNVTIEGIGEDAAIRGFGILIRNCANVEIRNFGIMLCMDDSLSLDTDNSNIWVHNMDCFYGSTGGDADQAKGDGTMDVKGGSTYVTFSYNHFWDSGKSSLCGMKSESTDSFITYHHNWFDHSDSRHPRIRTMSVHIYNNYFDGNSKYGVGMTMGGSAFVENNYFLDVTRPMMISQQGTDATGAGTFSGEAGGIIKAYNNKFAFDTIDSSKLTYVTQNNSSTSFDAVEVSNRTDNVGTDYKALSGGSTYNNFDTSWDLGVKSIDPVESVPSVVKANSGRMNGGDFPQDRSIYGGLTDASSYSVDTAFKSAMSSYKSSLVSIGGGSDSSGDKDSESSTEATTQKATEGKTEETTQATTTKTDSVSATFDPTALSAAADKEALAASEVSAPFGFEGVVVKRLTGGKVTSVEVGKANSGAITVSAKAGAVITVVVSSTGSSNTSAIGIGDSSGNILISDTVTGAAAAKKTVSYTVAADGVYRIISPEDANNRGVRVYSVEVSSASSSSAEESSTEATTAESSSGKTTEATTQATTEGKTEATTQATTETGGTDTKDTETPVKSSTFELRAASVGTTYTSGSVTLKALQDLVENKDSEGNVLSVKSNSVNNATVDGSKARALGVISSTADTSVVMKLNLSKGPKKGYVIESDTELEATASAPAVLSPGNAVVAIETTADDAYEGTKKFDVKAGKYYYLVAVGANFSVYSFAEADAGSATEETTQATTEGKTEETTQVTTEATTQATTEGKTEATTQTTTKAEETTQATTKAETMTEQTTSSAEDSEVITKSSTFEIKAATAGTTYISGSATLTALQDLGVQVSLYGDRLKSSGVNNATVEGKKARVWGVITSDTDTSVAVDVQLSPGKMAYVIESDVELYPSTDEPVAFDPAAAVYVVDATSVTSGDFFDKILIDVNRGKYYYLVAVGSNLMLTSFNEITKVETTETSTESTTETATKADETTQATTEATTQREESTEVTTKGTPMSYRLLAGDSVQVGNAVLTAVVDLTEQSFDTPYTVNGVEYVKGLKSNGENNVKVGSKTGRALGVVTVANDSDVTFVVKVNSEKVGYIVESDTLDDVSKTKITEGFVVFDESKATKFSGEGVFADTVSLKAGKYYYLVGIGTDLVFFDMIASESDSSDNVVYGDVNGDGRINMRDVTLLQQYRAGWISAKLTDEQLKAADVYKDGNVDGRDLLKLARYVAEWDGIILGQEG